MVVGCIMILEPQFVLGYGERPDEGDNDGDFTVMYHFQKAEIWMQTERYHTLFHGVGIVAEISFSRMLLSLVEALQSALSPNDSPSGEKLESLFSKVRKDYHALVELLCDITNPGFDLDMEFLPLMRVVATVPRIAHTKAVTFVRILREMDLAIRKSLPSPAGGEAESDSEPRYLLKRYDYFWNQSSGFSSTIVRQIRRVTEHLVKLSQEAARFKSTPTFDLDAISDSSLCDELPPELARMCRTLLVCTTLLADWPKPEIRCRDLKGLWSSVDGSPMPVDKTMKSIELAFVGFMGHWRNELHIALRLVL